MESLITELQGGRVMEVTDIDEFNLWVFGIDAKAVTRRRIELQRQRAERVVQRVLIGACIVSVGCLVGLWYLMPV